MKNSSLPCALLINDIHISKDNIQEFQINWDEALQLCKKLDITNMIVGGDMFLSRSSQTLDVLLAVRQAIIKATSVYHIELTIANGNHDLVDQESVLGYNHIFSEYPGVFVIDDYDIQDLSNNVVLYTMSYFPENGSFISRLNEIIKSLDGRKNNILYIHEGINGGLAVPSDDELPAAIFKPFTSVLVGHYHNRKKVDGTNIEYIGSSRQHNFGEDEEKGYTVLYEDGSYEFIKNEANTRYRVIDADVDDLTSDFIDMLAKIKSDKRYKVKVRIKCQAKQASTIDKQKLIESGVTKIELVTEQTNVKLTESQSITKKFDKLGIKQEYTNFCIERSISDVEMGLQYLDKIK